MTLGDCEKLGGGTGEEAGGQSGEKRKMIEEEEEEKEGRFKTESAPGEAVRKVLNWWD